MICMINISVAAKHYIGDLCVNCSTDGGGILYLHHWAVNVPTILSYVCFGKRSAFTVKKQY